MKKALLPILLILAGVVLLATVAYWYENNYGDNGPFPGTGH